MLRDGDFSLMNIISYMRESNFVLHFFQNSEALIRDFVL